MKLQGVAKNKYFIICFLVILCLGSIHIARAISAEPGTEGDPLVSKSYVDSKMSEFTSLANSLKQQVQTMQSQGGIIFTVVELKPGQELIAGAGAEIVLRSGSAKAIQGTYGGLADVTSDAGIELMTGDNIPKNHLLLVSRDDGRGLRTENEGAFLLVKGSYTIR